MYITFICNNKLWIQPCAQLRVSNTKTFLYQLPLTGFYFSRINKVLFCNNINYETVWKVTCKANVCSSMIFQFQNSSSININAVVRFFERTYSSTSQTQLNLSNICSKFRIVAIFVTIDLLARSRWPRDLRRGFEPASLLGFRVRIPPVTWLSVSCKCCVLSGISLCDGLILRPEEF